MRARVRRGRTAVVVATAATGLTALLGAQQAVAAVAPQPAPPVKTLKARWALDTVVGAGAARSTPDSVAGASALLSADSVVGPTDGGVPVPRVAGTGTAAFRFPGWTQTHVPGDPTTPSTEAAGGVIDPDASSLRVPSSTAFQPGLTFRKFQVTAFVRPLAPDGEILPSQSPKIVQKGRTEDAGGQWKLYHTADMRPGCTFVGVTGVGAGGNPRKVVVDALEDKAAARLAGRTLVAGTRYKVDCVFTRQSGTGATLVPNTVLVRVTPLNPPVPQAGWTVTASAEAAVFDVSPVGDVWIGHKPPLVDADGSLTCSGCDAPGDAYAGDLDDVQLYRWEKVG